MDHRARAGSFRPACGSRPHGIGCLSTTRLAVETDGTAWVVWQQNDSMFENSIWVQRRPASRR